MTPEEATLRRIERELWKAGVALGNAARLAADHPAMAEHAERVLELYHAAQKQEAIAIQTLKLRNRTLV